MQFSFTEDQLAFRDAVRDLLAKECPPEVVRAAWPEGPQADGSNPGEGSRADAERVDSVSTALAEMGVLGIAVPEEFGGLGMTEVDWVLLAEETGYAALPHPFVETAGVIAPLLAETGADAALLASLVEGSAQAACGRFDAQESVRVIGHPAAVPFVIDIDADPPVVFQASPVSLGGDPEASIDRSRTVRALESFGFGDTIGGPDDAGRAFDRIALGTAAQLIGLGRRMLDLSVAYAIERKQFGVPIGSQQAVKHHLADAALQLQFAAPAVYRAAWSLSTGDANASRDVSMAKAMASDAARLVGRKALQVHGAIGYTVEYDLHLYFKRAEALARSWGDAAWHRSRVADALGI